MEKWFKYFIELFLSKVNLRLVNNRYWLAVTSQLEEYNNIENHEGKQKILATLKSCNKLNLEKYQQLSQSQILQDIFVLDYFDYKHNGFFVEFGATNGLNLSNTYILEKHFNWNGILAEPGKNWHKDLNRNRNCSIETDCVWSSTGETLQFIEARSAELSTISNFENLDIHAKVRIKKRNYNVHSITLIDMLDRYGAPYKIDYLSIDTEGSEYEILKNFTFSKYSIGVITCEHNFGKNREKIKQLLESNGFLRVHEQISQFDDWYVNSKW
jgi:FkbM family methyltransferase